MTKQQYEGTIVLVIKCQLRIGDAELSYNFSWWRHQMEIFSTLLALCAGNLPVTGEFPSQRPVARSFDVFFDLRLNKRLSKQSWGWWLDTKSRSLWRRCNVKQVMLEIRYHGYIVCKFTKSPNHIWRTRQIWWNNPGILHMHWVIAPNIVSVCQR